jgi:nitrite reductase/ring-hydroxylating ferredoxin subunit
MPHVLHDGIEFDQITVTHPGGYEVILYNQAGTIHGYRNSCPHVGVGLDWGTGRCLSAPNELQCALHGAVFVADTGECIAGPCHGQSLTRVPVRIEDGKVVCG